VGRPRRSSAAISAAAARCGSRRRSDADSALPPVSAPTTLASSGHPDRGFAHFGCSWWRPPSLPAVHRCTNRHVKRLTERQRTATNAIMTAWQCGGQEVESLSSTFSTRPPSLREGGFRRSWCRVVATGSVSDAGSRPQCTLHPVGRVTGRGRGSICASPRTFMTTRDLQPFSGRGPSLSAVTGITRVKDTPDAG
jgi:hypothetical protein